MTRTKIALDANIPVRIVHMLNGGFKDAGYDFCWEPDFAPANAPDEFWAEAFRGLGGTAIISGDKNIARRPHQLEAFRDCELVCFFCSGSWSQADLAYQTGHLMRWWPEIQKLLSISRPGDCWWLPIGMRGEFKRVALPRRAAATTKPLLP